MHWGKHNNPTSYSELMSYSEPMEHFKNNLNLGLIGLLFLMCSDLNGREKICEQSTS